MATTTSTCRPIRGVSNFGDVRAAARQSGDDLVLDFGAHELKLLDTRLSNLNSDDFIY